MDANEKRCGIYKYVYKSEVIYVGKSQTNIKSRIDSHAREEKFQKYIKDTDIYYCFLPNESTTSIYELYYINKYKPILNKLDKGDGDMIGVNVEEIQWKLYSPYKFHYDSKNQNPSSVIKYNKCKIDSFKSLLTDCNKIKSEFDKFYNMVFQFYLNSERVKSLLIKHQDCNQFAGYSHYNFQMFRLNQFLNELQNDLDWNSYSSSFNREIDESNSVITELQQ